MDFLFYIAIGPAIYLMYYVYQMDRLETEPKKLLYKLVGFGALSIIPAVILELVGEIICVQTLRENSITYLLVENFLVVAVAEECSKYLMLRLLTWKNKAFNCSYDGLLYAVYVSMGFALIENILYVAFNGGALTGILRAVTALPGHCFFAVFMGVFYARAKNEAYLGHTGAALRNRLCGLGIAILAHGGYDFFISLGNIPGVVLFLALLVCLYIFGIKAIKLASAEDRYFDPVVMEQITLEGNWTCPACGTSNVGVLCTFCSWHIPESGSTAVPVLPQEPSRAGLLPTPKRNTKLTMKQRLLVVFSIVGNLALSMVLVPGSLDIRDPALLTIMSAFALAFFFAAIFLPVFLITRFYKQADRNDPRYQEELALYREARRKYDDENTIYEKQKEVYRDYEIAVKNAQKRREKENKA